MGASSGDDEKIVEQNRDMVFESVGCSVSAVVYPTQVHGSEIACIKKGNIESASGTLNFPDTDASVTDVPGVLLTSLHADCIPVWLYDRKRNVIGLAHAGWRGTRADVAAKTIHRMGEEFGCLPEDIIAVIGPGISRCCFEVGSEVYEEFKEMLPEYVSEFSTDDKNGKYHLDLKKINKILIERAGVSDIYISGLCTCCSSDELFYSYRRDGGITGRMCAGICIVN
jgi:hypothetical protein